MLKDGQNHKAPENGKPTKLVKCDMCDDIARAVYYLSHGCVCKPHLRVMALCQQHEVKTTPISTMEFITIVNKQIWETYEEEKN